jgi:hypothetical protein
MTKRQLTIISLVLFGPVAYLKLREYKEEAGMELYCINPTLFEFIFGIGGRKQKSHHSHQFEIVPYQIFWSK